MAQPFDKDKLMMLSRDRAATVAHEALTHINHLRPEEQMAAIATLFAVYTQRFGLEPSEMHTFGVKLITRQPFMRKGNAQLEALEAFAGMAHHGELV